MLKANERVEADSETTSCNHHLRSEIQNAILFSNKGQHIIMMLPKIEMKKNPEVISHPVHINSKGIRNVHTPVFSHRQLISRGH